MPENRVEIYIPSLPSVAEVVPFNLHEAIGDLDIFMGTAMETAPKSPITRQKWVSRRIIQWFLTTKRAHLGTVGT